MTYCVALKLDDGLVCLSDTRTNAGLDDVARYKKMFTWEAEDRAIILMTAGNLSVTQGVVDRLEQAIRTAEAGSPVGDDLQVTAPGETVYTVPSMFRLAQIVGLMMRSLLERHRAPMEKDGASSGAAIIVGGQIRGEPVRLFLVYSAGNFIECQDDTPYFQIGETKYGKPIIARTIRTGMPVGDALRMALVSMDSTVRSNLSVGLPLDMAVIETDTLAFTARRRIEDDDPTYLALSEGWSVALQEALDSLPALDHWFGQEGGGEG